MGKGKTLKNLQFIGIRFDLVYQMWLPMKVYHFWIEQNFFFFQTQTTMKRKPLKCPQMGFRLKIIWQKKNNNKNYTLYWILSPSYLTMRFIFIDSIKIFSVAFFLLYTKKKIIRKRCRFTFIINHHYYHCASTLRNANKFTLN